MQLQLTTQHGLCKCGCGHKTNLAAQSSTRQGWVKGEPMHYLPLHRQSRIGPEYIAEDRGFETPCWIWQGSCNSDGYGRKRNAKGQSAPAHRVYYEAMYGQVNDSFDVHHRCRVRACVNPEHLEALSKADHQRRPQKITKQDVSDIRARFVRNVVTQQMLAAEYGLSAGHINKILRGGRICS